MSDILIKDSDSPLFNHSLVYRPFKYQRLEELRVSHEKVHWVPDEVEMSDDVADWRLNMSDDEKAFVKENLLMFTTGDVVVADNYVTHFLPAFKNNEARNWLLSVSAREAVHQEAYAMANDTFGLPEADFGRFQEYRQMRERIDYMQTQYDPTTVQGVCKALAHTTFNEGVALFGAFVSLLNFGRSDVEGYKGKKGRLKGFSKINAWSLRDESMHVDGSTFLYKATLKDHKGVLNDEFKKFIYDTARKFVAAEDAYIDLVFKEYKLYSITKDEVKTYVRYMVDRRLIQLGHKGIFGITKNPSPWVDDMLGGAGGKKLGNFFEVRVDAYQTAGATSGDVNWEEVLK